MIDGDAVESSNLHRQVIYTRDDVGKSKAVSARSRILNLNNNIECVAYNEPFDEQNAYGLAKQYDIILDCTDDTKTRYLIAEAASRFLIRILRKHDIINSQVLKARCSRFCPAT